MQRDNHTTRGHLGLAAERRRRMTLQLLREVAAAEGHRDRARIALAKAEGIIVWGDGAGFDMSDEAAQVAGLRDALTIAEASFATARHAAGLPEAA